MWILPTMSRPEQCAEVLRRIREIGCSTKGVVFVNGLSLSDAYNSAIGSDLPEGWRIEFWPENIGCIGALNKCFELWPNEPFYGFLGDDEFLMEGNPSDWDLRLVNAAGSWDFSHGLDDVNRGMRAQGYLCIGGELVRALGYMAIPTGWHWFMLDCMYEWLAGRAAFGGAFVCKNILVPDVKIEHRHPYWDKAPMDSCYELGASRKEEDRKIFVDWLRKELPLVAERIKKAKSNA